MKKSPVIVAAVGLLATIIAVIYLMLAWPEASHGGLAEQVLDMGATYGAGESSARLSQIVSDLQFRAKVEVYLLQIILATLILDASLFGYLLWRGIKSGRIVGSDG